MDEQEVIRLIEEAIGIERGRLNIESKADDAPEWDSMGTLALLTVLDRHGVNMDPGGAAALQSVQGVLEVLRKAGKLS